MQGILEWYVSWYIVIYDTINLFLNMHKLYKRCLNIWQTWYLTINLAIIKVHSNNNNNIQFLYTVSMSYSDFGKYFAMTLAFLIQKQLCWLFIAVFRLFLIICIFSLAKDNFTWRRVDIRNRGFECLGDSIKTILDAGRRWCQRRYLV